MSMGMIQEKGKIEVTKENKVNCRGDVLEEAVEDGIQSINAQSGLG